jgi:putative ABC transport system permease protein
MTRHLLKLIWNRRRTNLLVMLEIFFSFLVVFGVATLGAYYAGNYRRPLGYSIDDVWSITISPNVHVEGENAPPEQMETIRQLFQAVKDFPEIMAVAGAVNSPHSNSSWTSGTNAGLRYEANQVTDDFRQLLGIELLRGRWFSREDDAAAFEPVVVNERLSHELFGADDPIGRDVPQDPDRSGKPRKEMRIIGLIPDFRQHGELAAPSNYLFKRKRLDEEAGLGFSGQFSGPGAVGRPPRLMLVKVRPGTPTAFEEKLVARMQAVARDWSFETQTLAQMRESALKQTLVPLIAVGMITGFLMLMVALGLTGVVWQTVTQRTKEIGLRRAKGATSADIHRQILGELVMMATLALAFGAVVVAHLPLFGLFHPKLPSAAPVTGDIYVQGLAVSVLAIYFLTVVCGWYPARLATRVQPAEALHYE